jgi:hypothetical protein
MYLLDGDKAGRKGSDRIGRFPQPPGDRNRDPGGPQITLRCLPTDTSSLLNPP